MSDHAAIGHEDGLPPEALLEGLPEPLPDVGNAIRSLVHACVPDAIERVRTGWRVIGYDVPIGRGKTAFFAWIMPQREHVHLGFPRGVLLGDPDRLLEGAGVTKLARWLTATRRAEIDAERWTALTLEAAALARTPGHATLARMVAERGARRP